MKIKIEIILGLLESGKTNFINSMLESDEIYNETIVVIQDELGQTDINYHNDKISKKNINLITIEHNTDDDINENYIKDIIIKYCPERIFIETNGMKNSSYILKVFNNDVLKKLCIVDDIVSIVDAETFNLYYRNMQDLLFSQIFNSEKIILNNLNKFTKNEITNIISQIKNINETASIMEYSEFEDSPDYSYLELYDNNKNVFTFKTYIFIFLIIFSFTALSAFSLLDFSISSQYLTTLNKFYTVFISILIEGIPFILIGSFLSALIQIYVSKEFIIKVLPHNIFLSCIIAAFAGIIFPICDCGTIPIVKGFIRKKVPTAACITFLLSAPIVNPIAIISTLYAFQDMKYVVIYRIFSGIIIAILIGLIIHFFTRDNPNILKNNTDPLSCECAICSDSYEDSKASIDTLRNIFFHTSDEFFNIGKFMIIGAFISSIFQTIVYFDSNLYFPNDNRTSLLIMILLAFLLSVCSTSDAFIAKGFLKLFSLNSVMGFLVVGPMLDIKNTFMLFGNFKKTFVLKLIFCIVIISFTVLINFNFS
ncbi:permease [Clostridium butyricum]|uniref:permease n=1 Tax=Clostridium butyricum TaxID=1492 RepID=UPI00168B29EC|nr:permease [Clostridium butyricum]MDB2152172.1 permease [Clostridium butyricum]